MNIQILSKDANGNLRYKIKCTGVVLCKDSWYRIVNLDIKKVIDFKFLDHDALNRIRASKFQSSTGKTYGERGTIVNTVKEQNLKYLLTIKELAEEPSILDTMFALDENG